MISDRCPFCDRDDITILGLVSGESDYSDTVIVCNYCGREATITPEGTVR